MTRHFSEKSLARLQTCHPSLQAICQLVLDKYMDFTVLWGHRGEEDQNRMVAEGHSHTLWPTSKHNCNPSMAVDLAPYPIDWRDQARFGYLAGLMMELGASWLAENDPQHALRWGGDWDRDGETADQTLHDLGHFELIPS